MLLVQDDQSVYGATLDLLKCGVKIDNAKLRESWSHILYLPGAALVTHAGQPTHYAIRE